MIARVFAALLVALLPMQALAAGQLVYLGLRDDPYYEPQKAYTGLSLRDRSRPLAGIEVAMRSARILERTLGLEFRFEEHLTEDSEAAVRAAGDAIGEGAAAILLDLPPDAMDAVVTEFGRTGTALINIRESARRWRGEHCTPDLLHTVPSDGMLADAIAQHLRKQGWDRVLLLSGNLPDDLSQADAARRAIAKFGLRLVAERQFQLSNNPRQRDLNNIRLLTGGKQHDVVWLVDSYGEFGRFVPYATHYSTPVVGSEGLRAEAWHWTFDRYGAPQLNQRFQRHADRTMTGVDWSAWAAARAVIESAQRIGSLDADRILAYLRGDELSLDLYKGAAGSFRGWNGQLRQPILLTTHNAVIAVAPLDGFEHRTDTLDTLGADEAERTCRY